ncbi:MAG: hypothetical protein U1E25_11790 [Methylocystis sp.]
MAASASGADRLSLVNKATGVSSLIDRFRLREASAKQKDHRRANAWEVYLVSLNLYCLAPSRLQIVNMLASSAGATDRQMIADIIRYQAIERHWGE